MSPTTVPLALTRRSLLATLVSACSAAALAGCAGPALASPGLATLEIYDRDGGQVIPSYFKDGRLFVPGRPGARYALRLRNLTSARVLVVLSVDGINVITGETADWRQTGYVLDPGRSYDINGWRKSGTEVAAFEFAPIQRSYAAQTGRPDHVGVIGMAVFRERYVPPPPPVSMAPPAMARSESRAADGATAAAPAGQMREKSAMEDNVSARLGTGHGQREWSVSRRTDFERASRSPDEVVRLEYDSWERLVDAGVIPAPYAWSQPSPRPRPFPANPPGGYVPDPPRR